MFKINKSGCLLAVMVVILISSINRDCVAQQIKFTHLTTDDGLSQSTVHCIVKDKDGFMWFGTDDGLNQYDGYKFTVYRHESNNAASVSGNTISSLFIDKAGNLWAGTNNGLSKYDRKTGMFINYGTSNTNPLTNKDITCLSEDNSGNILIGTYWNLNILNVSTGKITQIIADKKKSGSLSNENITAIYKDSKHHVWIGTTYGLDLFNETTKTFTSYLHQNNVSGSISNNFIQAIGEDRNGNLWIGTNGGGLNKYIAASNSFIAYNNNPKNPNSISSNTIFSIAAAQGNSLWVGTEQGIDLFDINTNTFKVYRNDPNDNYSFHGNSVRAILLDDNGLLWVSSYSGGINKYDPNLPLFNSYVSRGKNNDLGLSYRVVTSFAEKNKNEIYVGTDGGGLNILNLKTNKFSSYQADPLHKNGIVNNSVLSLVKDKNDEKLWIATYAGGVDLFDPAEQTFKHYRAGPGKNQLSSDNIFALFEDSKGNIWIGTNGDGINVLNTHTQVVTRYRNDPASQDTTTLSNNVIRSFYEAVNGDIWIATFDGGICIFHPATKKFTRLNSANTGLSSDIVLCIFGDHKQHIWAGTMGGGLDLYDAARKKFISYTVANGLSNNVINSIQEDDKGYLWLSTNNGISRFNLSNHAFKNFNLENGLQGKEFFLNSGFHSSTGELYFGGINGMNVIDPDHIAENRNIPRINLTGFQLFNKPVQIGAKNSPLNTIPPEIQTIRLVHSQSVFTLEFSAMDYTLPAANQYAYQLVGFDNGWNYIGTDHKASYTNLDAGTYTFKVKASNNDGVWNTNGLSIQIVILPPFWLTWWFRLGALLLIVAIIYLVYRIRVNQIKKQKNNLEIQVKERTAEVTKQSIDLLDLNEELQAQSEELQSLNEELLDQTGKLQFVNAELEEQKIHEQEARKEAERASADAEKANKAKSIFLATMSHEIRTPMNGVLGMASLLNETKLDEEQKEYSQTILHSGEALLNVINDILDFSKIESGKMELDPYEFNLRNCVEEVLELFTQKSSESGIELLSDLDYDLPANIITDGTRLRQVLINLLGNAIKFTTQGEICLTIKLLSDNQGVLNLGFEVKDTGIGIPQNKLSDLFQAFSQVDSSTTRKYGGTGLGLAISERLVALMNGKIDVESTPGKGTTFSFSILCEKGSNSQQDAFISDKDLTGKRILIVDDNNTNLTILKKQLEHWNMSPVDVSSAAEALDLLEKKEKFDLVITDMQMPGMDGVQLSEQIKQRFNDLPIIVLSSIGDETRRKFPHLFSATLTKPVKQQHLYKVIKQALSANHQQPQQYNNSLFSQDFALQYPFDILVAEDNAVNQLLVMKILEKLGYRADLAVNGNEAVKMHKANTYDLILMDVQMPEMNGLEATGIIRKISEKQPVIIAMTANAMAEDKEECLRAGMDNYISKPIKLNAFVNLLKETVI